MSRNFSTGGEWILIHRQKTGTEANIKLLDYPKQIMEKYRGLCEDGRVFPVPIYKSCMRALERLGKEMWHNQASHLAFGPPHVRNVNLSLQWSADRDSKFVIRSQEY